MMIHKIKKHEHLVVEQQSLFYDGPQRIISHNSKL